LTIGSNIDGSKIKDWQLLDITYQGPRSHQYSDFHRSTLGFNQSVRESEFQIHFESGMISAPAFGTPIGPLTESISKKYFHPWADKVLGFELKANSDTSPVY
jgi:hypothetical protein